MKRLVASLAAASLAPVAVAQRAPVPPPVAIACDGALTVAEKAPGTRATRSTGEVTDELLRGSLSGCRVDVSGSFKRLRDTMAVPERLREWFASRDWTELPDFSADGHDGTSFAYATADVACLVRGAWDGGSDDEPDAPRADPYTVAVLCGPVSAFIRR